MKHRLPLVCLALLACAAAVSAAEPISLFDGNDLTGWEGDPAVWTVEEKAIVGRNTAEAPIKNNTFLIWKGGPLDDFRLKLQYRIEGGNSGVQYRSRIDDPQKWIVGGYQADIDSQKRYTGILYDERGRGILAERGQKVKIARDGTKQVETFADAAELQKVVRPDDWNDYVIEARGDTLSHFVNGELMSETTDSQSEKRSGRGILALQVHTGPPMVVRFRRLELERLSADSPDLRTE